MSDSVHLIPLTPQRLPTLTSSEVAYDRRLNPTLVKMKSLEALIQLIAIQGLPCGWKI